MFEQNGTYRGGKNCTYKKCCVEGYGERKERYEIREIEFRIQNKSDKSAYLESARHQFKGVKIGGSNEVVQYRHDLVIRHIDLRRVRDTSKRSEGGRKGGREGRKKRVRLEKIGGKM